MSTFTHSTDSVGY